MNYRFIIIFFLLFFFISVYAENNPSLISFETIVEKEVEADIAVIKIQVEKKDRNFSTASSECGKVLNLIKEKMKKAGVDEKDIVIRNFKGYPDFNFFGKEYSVTGYIDIKVRDKNNIMIIFQGISDITDPQIRVNSIEYIIEDPDKLKNNMVREASKKILEKKIIYEESFFIKLQLYSLNEVSSDIGFNTPVMRNFSVGKSSIPEPSAEYIAPDNLISFPVKKVYLRLFVNFEIIK